MKEMNVNYEYGLHIWQERDSKLNISGEIQLEHLDHEESGKIKHTGDGSIDRFGRAAIKSKTGGWNAAILILGIYKNSSSYLLKKFSQLLMFYMYDVLVLSTFFFWM